MTCDDLAAVIPWPAFLLVCLLCFSFGATLGICYERRRAARTSTSASSISGQEEGP